MVKAAGAGIVWAVPAGIRRPFLRKGEMMAANGRTQGLSWMRLVVAAFPTLMLTGCVAKSAPPPAYMRPQSLYLKEQPYSRLYVEVDAVEGVEIPDRWLDELKTFLSEHCLKPDGIEMVRDPPIPASEVKGVPFAYAALCALDGPRPPDRPQPAYLHVFFQNGPIRVDKREIFSGIDFYCPSSIFYDAEYAPKWNEQVAVPCLQHEAGHILGLSRNTDHGDGMHCGNRGCLMRPSPDLLSNIGVLFGASWKPSLCSACGRDLQATKSEGTDGELSFVGPFLVRREDGYSVVSMSGWHVIAVGPVDEVFDWRKALPDMKATIRKRREQLTAEKPDAKKRGNPWCFHVVYARPGADGRFANVTEVSAALEKALHDPCPMVEHMATVRLKELKEKAADEFQDPNVMDTGSSPEDISRAD